MKKLLFAAALLLSTLGVNAQRETGTFSVQPKVGITLANLTGGESNYKVGAIAGAEFEYQACPVVGVSFGALYSMQGAKAKEGDVKMNLDYINIPILANFYLAKGFALKAGIQPAFNVSNKVKAEGISLDWNKAFEGTGAEVKTFDFSIPVGLSYEISDFVIDARYNIGLTKITDLDTNKNSVFQLTVGYKFDL